MTPAELYAYLVRSRRDLWEFLESLPDEGLSRTVIPGDGARFRNIKDLVLHVAAVEDSWLHEDILAREPVWTRLPGFPGVLDSPSYGHLPLAFMLEYWRAVEAATLAYLASVTPGELARLVRVERSSGVWVYPVEDLLRHVTLHEARHVAQMAVLARQQGFAPPFLDYLRYSGMPVAPRPAGPE